MLWIPHQLGMTILIQLQRIEILIIHLFVYMILPFESIRFSQFNWRHFVQCFFCILNVTKLNFFSVILEQLEQQKVSVLR